MRLIDADALLEKREFFDCYECGDDCYFGYIDVDAVKNAPTIDPETLRPTGRWVTTIYTTTSKRNRVISNQKFSCSECGYSNGRKQSNYCPNCGAKMEG